jgi:hypothetical protein
MNTIGETERQQFNNEGPPPDPRPSVSRCLFVGAARLSPLPSVDSSGALRYKTGSPFLKNTRKGGQRMAAFRPPCRSTRSVIFKST